VIVKGAGARLIAQKSSDDQTLCPLADRVLCELVPWLHMRQLRGRPRLRDPNRRGPSISAQAVRDPDASRAASERVGTRGLVALEDFLDANADGEGEWDAFDLFSIDVQEVPQ